jgi:predicted aminopeptidase
MPKEDEREQALHHAARLRGLSLVRADDTFALAVYTAATLDEIAAFLATDATPDVEYRRVEEQRRADLLAMLKSERALIAELEAEKQQTDASGSDHAATEAALAEIRRRIAEIQQAERDIALK